jgi:hypothetical protein
MSVTSEHANDQTLHLPLMDAPREPAAGDVLAGRYRLLALIGEGGMARVFRARDERLLRDVAVKIARGGRQPAPAPLREEHAASAMFHPNVVAVFDGGRLPDGEPGAGRAFIVMEYIAGNTVCDVAPLDWERALEIVRQAADGLAAAHRNGVIHNDIKPSNVLVGNDGCVKLADFGAAATTQTEIGDYVHGTPAYIAPERLAGARPDPRHDIYGLGGVLAFLLTGQHPLHVRVPTLPEDCPRRIAELVTRARSLDPAERFPDADAFRSALRDVTPRSVLPRAATPSIPTRADPPGRPAQRLARRPPVPRHPQRVSARAVAMVAALLLAILLAAGGGLVAPRIISRDAGAPAAAAASMPDLTGMSFGQAADACAARKLTIERIDVVYGPGPLNQVVEQSPAPGATLRAGDTVRLVVRTGR